MFPQARQDRLLIREIGEELIVYDQLRHRAHRLNATAALIWRHCDGGSSPADLAVLVEKVHGLPAGGEMVGLALERLARAHLLQEPPSPFPGASPLSRRRLLRELGLAGAASLLVPTVTSLTAPTPLAADSGTGGDENPPPRGGGAGKEGDTKPECEGFHELKEPRSVWGSDDDNGEAEKHLYAQAKEICDGVCKNKKCPKDLDCERQDVVLKNKQNKYKGYWTATLTHCQCRCKKKK